MKTTLKIILNCCLFILSTTAFSMNESGIDTSLLHQPQQITQDSSGMMDYLYLAKTFSLTNPAKALDLSQKAIRLAVSAKQKTSLPRAYKYAGLASYGLNQFSQAILYYDTAYKHAQALGDSVEMAKILNNYGLVYSDMGHYLKAIDYYNHALELNRLTGNKKSIGYNNNNIGSLYYKLQAYDQAAAYFEEAYQIALSIQDQPSMLSTRNNLGLIRQAEGKHNESIQLFRECLSLAASLNNHLGKADAMLNIGNIYLETGQTDSAFHYLTQSLHLYEDNNKSTARAWFGIGKAHQLNNNKRQALNAFQKADADLIDHSDPEFRIQVLKELYQTWDNLGNQGEAFKALKTYHEIFDSVKQLFDSASVENLQARFEVEKKMEEVAELENEKVEQTKVIVYEKEKNKTNILLLYFSLLAVVILLITLGLYFAMYRKLKKANNQLHEQNNLMEEARDLLAERNATIAEQEEKLLMLINALPDIVCFKDGLGRWVIANEADLSLFGLKDQDYKGKTDLDLIPLSPHNDLAFRACIVSDEEAWQQRKMTRSDEIITDPQGCEHVYDVIKIPLFYANGARKALIVIGRDITERKQTETRLSEALRQAEESDKLKSAFLSNMSHEIRTPLNAVIGFSELLEDEKISRETMRTYLRHIRDNGNTLMTLIADILELSRIESGTIKLKQEAVHLNEFFQQLHTDFLQLASQKNKNHLRIILSAPAEDVVVKTDKQRIKQLMINLYDNALKFTGEGHITFGFAMKHHLSSGLWLQLFVKDTGIGIPNSKKHLLFKRFTKIHESSGMVYPGAGLGLSIVEQIVNQFNGTIHIESEPTTGTYVSIMLPAIEAKLTEITKQILQETTDQLQGKKVLVVEDVESNFDLLKIILESVGMIVIKAIEGGKAIELCRTHPDLDLVLMDIQLPGINGYQATKEIKKIRPQLPVIAQTAFAMTEEKDACFSAGCDGYIAKPIKSQLLLPVLLEVLGKNFS